MNINSIFDGECKPLDAGDHLGSWGAIAGTGKAEYTQDVLAPDFSSKPYEIYCGDALETIRQLKVGGTQFDCVVTSPPYFNQRKYGDDPMEIGRESGVESFIANLVTIFKEIPVRPWASLWVNLGDKRSANGTLLGVPSLFVTAMLKAGFFLKDEVVWAKEVVPVEGKSIGHCQVEPAPGRLNGNGWEPFFRFIVNPTGAWTDTSAVRIPRDNEHFFHQGTETPVEQHRYSTAMQCVTSLEGRNISNVWHIGNSRHGEGHFAAYPGELVERPIAMTCPEYLVDDAGQTKPRERIVEPTVYSEGLGRGKRGMGQYSLAESKLDDSRLTRDEKEGLIENLREKSGRMDFARDYTPRYPKPKGWTHMDKAVVGPGIVFDPFGGNGTTGQVSILLGRRFVGIDLYQANAARMTQRCEKAFETLKIKRNVN